MNLSSGTVNYGKEQIRFSVLYSARKTLGIEVHPDCNVLVKAPVGTDPAEIQKRVFKRVRWILRQQHYFRQFDPKTPGRQYIGGETHLYLGRQFRLKIIKGSQDSVKLIRGYFRVELKSPPCSIGSNICWIDGMRRKQQPGSKKTLVAAGLILKNSTLRNPDCRYVVCEKDGGACQRMENLPLTQI